MLGNTPERRYLHSHWTDILSVFNKVIRHVNDTNWSCSGVFWFHVFGCSLEVSFVSNVESIPRTELGRLARFLSMAYLAHVVTSKYDLWNCFFLFQHARTAVFILPSYVVTCIGTCRKGRPTNEIWIFSGSLSRILRNYVDFIFGMVFGIGMGTVCQVIIGKYYLSKLNPIIYRNQVDRNIWVLFAVEFIFAVTHY